jgi:hypothetical protein
MKKLLLAVVLCSALAGFVAVIAVSNEAGAEPGKPSRGVLAPIGVAQGELIYVPIYSRIYYEDTKTALELAATLSIHNVNPERSIVVTKADYYSTAGKPIHKYLDAPLVLNPLETKSLIVEKTNVAGGPGANFLVEWHADTKVVSPLVEALMVNAAHNLGIAFTSSGRVIQRVGPNAD